MVPDRSGARVREGLSFQTIWGNRYQIGKIAKCRNVWTVPDMPKTRSGKIMRRVLGAISNKGDVGNVMTLANPEVVEQIQKMVA